jgi:uncharacterized protein
MKTIRILYLAAFFVICQLPLQAQKNNMDQRLSVLTIGADNLAAMRAFYVEKFGWTPVAENKDIIFFKLNGFLFSLYGSKDLFAHAGKPVKDKAGGSFTMAYMVNSQEEVSQLYAVLKEKGVKIIKEPVSPPFGGYFFLLEDIEGNVWEVAYNPFIPIDKDGQVITHKNIDHL